MSIVAFDESCGHHVFLRGFFIDGRRSLSPLAGASKEQQSCYHWLTVALRAALSLSSKYDVWGVNVSNVKFSPPYF